MPYVGYRPPLSPVDGTDINDGSIAAVDIAANAVTAVKIADAAVTHSKLNANTAHTDRNQTFTLAQRGAISALGVQTSTVTLNLNTSNYFNLTA